jgi:hypothetical protein
MFTWIVYSQPLRSERTCVGRLLTDLSSGKQLVILEKPHLGKEVEMADQVNAHEDPVGGAELPEVSGDRRASPDALVTAGAERAPPPVDQAEQGCQLVEIGPAEPTLPVRVERVVLGVAREASEPFVLPPKGIIPFVLGNKHVWRRFMASTVVVAIALLVVAVALRVAGIHLDSVITVSITSAATALGVAARAYFGQSRGPKQPPTPDTASDDFSSS